MYPVFVALHDLIEIRVTYPVFTDTFHDATIRSPYLRPVSHVVLAGVVNAAIVAFAGFLCVDVC